jgi:hypothetical protein
MQLNTNIHMQCGTRFIWLALSVAGLQFLVACVPAAVRRAQPQTIPSVVAQDEYAVELTRLEGPDLEIGRFADVKHLGEGRFIIAALYGYATVEANGSDRYRVVEVVPFDPRPQSRFPSPILLVDIDADGRWEGLGLGRHADLYDEQGEHLWTAAAPSSVYPPEVVIPVQADQDPELEMIQIYNVFNDARLVQADGAVHGALNLPYNSYYHLLPMDVTGDGVDELLGAFSNHVVLWSFRDGVLADLDLEEGRAVSFARIPGSSLALDDQMQFSMLRFWENGEVGPFGIMRQVLGTSVLTLARSGDTWTLTASAIEPYSRDPASLKGIIPETASLGREPNLWLTVTDQWPPLVRVGSTELGTIYRHRLNTDLREAVASEGAVAIDRDSDAPLEAWIIWKDGVWRLRVTNTDLQAPPEE